MALIVNETILDLGELGVVAMSIGTWHDLPIPAQRFGYATLHRYDGQTLDAAALCTRRVARSLLEELIAAERTRLRSAVASVTGRIEWIAEQVSDDYSESPTAAYALSGGRALFIFGGKVAPHVFRVVDFSAMQIVFEETLDQLRKRFGIKQIPFQSEFMPFIPVVYAANSDHICVLLGTKTKVLYIGKRRFELVDVPKNSHAFHVYLTKSHWLAPMDETPQVKFGSLTDTQRTSNFLTTTKKKKQPALSCAIAADRFAFSHTGGDIEIVDIDDTLVAQAVATIRPIARTSSKDSLNVTFSPSGRYCLARAWEQSMLIDLDEMRSAHVEPPNAMMEFDRERVSREIEYRLAWALTERGCYVLHKRTLQHTPFDALSWSAIASGKKSAAPAPAIRRLDSLVRNWRRKAVRLERDPAGKSRNKDKKSRLYGDPYLPGDITWPAHESVPMAFLCQLAMDEIPAAMRDPLWPTVGALLFFVAMNEDGDLLEDDMFNPSHVCVMWIPALAGVARERADGFRVDGRPVAFVEDPSTLPQTDAVIVAAANLDDDEYDQYRATVEAVLPDGAMDGDRFGGYPHLLQSNTLEFTALAMAHGRQAEDGDVAEAAKWRLLLQIASDDLFMWGTDSGILYFMIHEDDLATKRFDRVQAICEGL